MGELLSGAQLSADHFDFTMSTQPGFEGCLRTIGHYEGFPLVALENFSGIEQKTLIIACLFRELVGQGYKGSYENVRDKLVRLLPTGRKNAADSLSKTSVLATSRQAAFLFLRRPEELNVEEQEQLCTLRQINLEVDLAYELVQQFAQMLRTRDF